MTIKYRIVKPGRGANSKIGPMLAVYSGAETCPESCPLNGRGCYAQQHQWISYFWKTVSQTLIHVCMAVRALPKGAPWRYGVAGDLPGRGEFIAPLALRFLVRANARRRVIAYTHKPATPRNVELVREANQAGFTINWSAEGLKKADVLASLEAGPVVAVVPASTPAKGARTPGGRPVVVCPAQWKDGVTCATCQACAVSTRKAVIGFWPHGSGARKVEELIPG